MRLFCVFFSLMAVAITATAAEFEFTFPGSHDGSTQQGFAFAPDGTTAESAPMPLLVVAHFMGGDRYTGKNSGYHKEAAERGWLVVTPELHGKNTPGGKTSFAAREAQSDVLDSIAYMQENFPVDKNRIYIVGRSMGGMMTQLMMAKHPDIFAAGVAGQGCGNITRLDQLAKVVADSAKKECGDDPFEYERRSSHSYAPNFAYAPLIMWHGTNDAFVHCDQTRELERAIKEHQTDAVPVFYLPGNSHLDRNVSAKWVCDQLEPYSNFSDFGTPYRWYPSLNFVTDESQKFFYLEIEIADKDKFAKIDTTISPPAEYALSVRGYEPSGDLAMWFATENVASLTIDLDAIPKEFHPKFFVNISTTGSDPKVYVIRDGEKSKIDVAYAAQ